LLHLDFALLFGGSTVGGHASWEIAQNALIAFYSKQWKDGKCRIRKEHQEYPNKSLAEAFDEKRNLVGGANKNDLA
jgi:hypothetical protein